jgi:hypothetical protein
LFCCKLSDFGLSDYQLCFGTIKKISVPSSEFGIHTLDNSIHFHIKDVMFMASYLYKSRSCIMYDINIPNDPSIFVCFLLHCSMFIASNISFPSPVYHLLFLFFLCLSPLAPSVPLLLSPVPLLSLVTRILFFSVFTSPLCLYLTPLVPLLSSIFISYSSPVSRPSPLIFLCLASHLLFLSCLPSLTSCSTLFLHPICFP